MGYLLVHNITGPARGAGRGRGQKAGAIGAKLLGDVEDFNAPLFEHPSDFKRWCDAQTKPRELIERLGAEIRTDRRLSDMLQRAGQHAARRQAAYLFAGYGVKASDTSIEDAASDAVLEVLSRMSFLSEDWPGDNVSNSVELDTLATVWRLANLGAWRSLRSWATVGMTGDTASLPLPMSWQNWLCDALVDLQQAQAEPMGQTERRARFAVCRWLYGVLVQDFRCNVKTEGRRGTYLKQAMDAARRRWRVLANVVFGQTLVDSCALSQFGSVEAFLKSMQQSGAWEALRAARLDHECVRVELARIGKRRFALEAAGAVRAIRQLAGDWPSSGGRWWRDPAKRLAWRRLADTRARCLELAKFWRDVERAHVQANDQAWQRAKVGLYAGKFANLQTLAGVRDSKAINPAFIRRAKG